MPNGLSLLSNGYGFYEALPVPPRNLCKPQTAAVHANNTIEFQFQPQLETIYCCDQSRTTRFLSPGEPSTPPGTPASTAASAPSPSTSTSDMDRCPSPSWATAISTEDARQLMETYVRHSPWFQTNAIELSVGDDGVPTFARLLARPGESVYRCFVDTRKDRKGKPVYYCSDCGFKSDRLHRLIGHQRSKRGHRPFACPDNGWYVHSPPPPPPSAPQPLTTPHLAPRAPLSVRRATANCLFRVCCSDFRGYSAESLGDHRSDRNGLQTCEWWYVQSISLCFSRTG